MKPDLIFEILQLAIWVAWEQSSRNVQHDPAFEETLLEIVQRSAQAYQEHTGMELDPLLIGAGEGE